MPRTIGVAAPTRARTRMNWRRPVFHWLPRLLLALFLASIFFPLPRYLRGLERGEFVVWLSQVLWVAGLLLACGLLVMAAVWWLRRRGRGRGPLP